MNYQSTDISIQTNGRCLIEITDQVNRLLAQHGTQQGLCTLFIQHTSASLTISENADPSVLVDLEYYLSKVVQDGDPNYRHDAEGPDDMAAHIRSVLTQSSMTIPIEKGRLALGTWQGVFVWEHRVRPHTRRIKVSILGTSG